ncbi:MAG: hypothetical protein ACLR5G_10600 [Eubacteriales bacterium]
MNAFIDSHERRHFRQICNNYFGDGTRILTSCTLDESKDQLIGDQRGL